MLQIGILKGHSKGVPSIKWSNEDEHKLVSTGFDGTVRVWNTNTFECISLYQSRGSAFCATFWPKDDNFVICSGHNESLYMFDTRTRMDKNVGECENRLKLSVLITRSLYSKIYKGKARRFTMGRCGYSKGGD